MVAKRGTQQRFESSKLEHSQLDRDDQQVSAQNIKKYKKIRANIGLKDNNRGTEIKGALDSRISKMMADSNNTKSKNRQSSNRSSRGFFSVASSSMLDENT